MPGPLTLATTLGRCFPPHGDASSHVRAAGFEWVTAHADRPTDLFPNVRCWNHLRDFLTDPDDPDAPILFELPHPNPGSRGHVTVDNTRHELLCVPYDVTPGSMRTTIRAYSRVDPAWFQDLARPTRHLLVALDACPTGRPCEQLFNLATDDLAAATEPFLNLPAETATTLAETLDAYPAAALPSLTELLDVAHAL